MYLTSDIELVFTGTHSILQAWKLFPYITLDYRLFCLSGNDPTVVFQLDITCDRNMTCFEN